MNEKMKKHLIDAFNKGVRMDGRGLQDFREITIEKGVSSTAHGSARVKAGNAEIIAGVKIDLGTPYEDTPDEGSLMVSAELTPLSHRKFESGPPGIDSIEAARVTDRSIRESKAMDVKKLCIKSGEQIWNVSVDIMPVAFDGNMIDLSTVAALAAIQDARLPKLDGDKVDYEDLTDEKLPMTEVPVAVTIFKYGDKLVVDPTEVEERYYDARLTIGTLSNGNTCSMQKGGQGTLTMEDIEEMVKIAVDTGKKIRGALK